MTDPMNTDPFALDKRKRTVIVGASDGMGAELARQLAGEGMLVALLARRMDKLETLVGQINSRAGETVANAYAHDVTDLENITPTFQQLLKDLGRIDTLVYVAGANPAVAIDEYDFDKDKLMLDTNLTAAVGWLGQAAILFERMGGGQIVGISSVAGDRGRVLNPGYGASKAGLSAYLESLRNRLTRKGVNVLTIKPGRIDTEITRAMGITNAFPVDRAAALIVKAMRQRKQTAYIPGTWRWIMLIIRHIPSFIFRRLSF